MKTEVLDDFTDLSAWMPVASGLAELEISADLTADGPCMRLDFDFKGGGGFVVARRPLSRAIPESFAVSFTIRGRALANRFELKLADPSGRNVWWRHWDAFELPAETERLAIRSQEIEFAYGPAGGGALRELGAVELAIAAGPGGAGTVWIGDLRIEDRTYRRTPVVRASSAQPGHPAAQALDGDAATSWLAETTAPAPHRLEIDFLEEREYGGLSIRWAKDATPARLRLETSPDGRSWATAHEAEPGGVAETSWIHLPGGVSRFLRLALDASPGRAVGVADIGVEPFEFSRSIDAFFGEIARREPRGRHPRWLVGEQTYWTPIGLADGETCAIMNEEGAVEVDRGTFTVEPFLRSDGRLLTWADAEVSQALADEWIPVPSSVWCIGDLTLRVTAFAARRAGLATLFVRYRVENGATAARRVALFAAVRPFQVNPPWQKFGALGGSRSIREIAWDGRALRIDGERLLIPLGTSSGCGAAPFEAGEISTHLARGALPPSPSARDRFGYASAALAFDLTVDPAGASEVYLAAPFGAHGPEVVAELAAVDAAAALAATLADWRARLGRVSFTGPPAARPATLTARTATAQVLTNRDGPALQPGPRRYTRSWIRDGAIMAAALLRMGRSAEAAEYVRWYARHQREDGNVPCCVDRNGPDWLPEHDSHGELIFAVMEHYRFARDRDLLAEMWPAVQGAVAYLEKLRAERLTPEYEKPELRVRYGLLPESASHEGYLAQPVHSYWDDFWALQGYRDAAAMAAILGEEAESRRLGEIGEAFRAAIRASLELTIRERRIDYVPGSVEWADFDPTATANAISLLGLADDLPRRQLDFTFDEYLRGFRRRRSGEIDWNNYSAYEIRILGALVCLGRRDDAAELLDFFLGDRRPRDWNQWPEISWRDPRSPGHVGDVPHTWIGAEFVLALRNVFAYERVGDGSLVVAAGIPSDWLDGDEEVGVAGLPTYHGSIDLRLRRDGDRLRVSIAGDVSPPGGILLRPPLRRAPRSVEVNGRECSGIDELGVRILALPAEVVVRS